MSHKGRVLFLSPHPDDHLMCAGLLFKLKKAGWELREVLFTNGSKGGKENVRKRRQEEYKKACKMLGIKKVYYFAFVNRSQWAQNFPLDNLIKIYQEYTPLILIMPNPKDYHLEHRSVTKIGIEALLSANIYNLSYRVPIVLFTHGFLPSKSDILIDITSVYNDKEELASIYSKEMTPHMRQWMEGESLYFGYFVRRKKITQNSRAEAFSIPEEWPADISGLII